jgi:magnesium transporter
MPRISGLRSRKAGLAPGTLVHVGKRKLGAVKISRIDYTEDWLTERSALSAADALVTKRRPKVRWINVDGLQQVDVLEKLGSYFKIHPLVLEDILHTGQRPKMENYDSTLFLVVRMLRYNERERIVEDEQVSIVLGSNFVLSFQEGIEGDVFDPIRERIRRKKGLIRSQGADYLAYSLLDGVIDQYFAIVERLGERVEDLEHELLENPTRATLQEMYRLKRELLLVRKSVWPLREVVHQLDRGDCPLFGKSIRLYLRDLHDHALSVLDALENERELLSGMIDIYLSSVSYRLNEVMKVLTIIATIFIPLTFIVGVYGMNFDMSTSPWNMPELRWYWGYPAILAVMTMMGIGMLVYFKRKKWF